MGLLVLVGLIVAIGIISESWKWKNLKKPIDGADWYGKFIAVQGTMPRQKTKQNTNKHHEKSNEHRKTNLETKLSRRP